MSDPSDLHTVDDPKVSELYRRSRTEQPPAELDSAILNQARRQTSRRKPRLLLPLASAALLLLGLSLTLQVLDLDKPLDRTLEESGIPAPLTETVDQAKSQTKARNIPTTEHRSMAQPTAKSPLPAERKAATPPPALREAAPETATMEMMEHRSRPAPAIMDAVPPTPAPMGGRDIGSRLQFIRNLMQQGRRPEAREALHALLQSHPDLDIPEELRSLLPHP